MMYGDFHQIDFKFIPHSLIFKNGFVGDIAFSGK